jgi:hypothetical protein
VRGDRERERDLSPFVEIKGNGVIQQVQCLGDCQRALLGHLFTCIQSEDRGQILDILGRSSIALLTSDINRPNCGDHEEWKQTFREVCQDLFLQKSAIHPLLTGGGDSDQSP